MQQPSHACRAHEQRRKSEALLKYSICYGCMQLTQFKPVLSTYSALDTEQHATSSNSSARVQRMPCETLLPSTRAQASVGCVHRAALAQSTVHICTQQQYWHSIQCCVQLATLVWLSTHLPVTDACSAWGPWRMCVCVCELTKASIVRSKVQVMRKCMSERRCAAAAHV